MLKKPFKKISLSLRIDKNCLNEINIAQYLLKEKLGIKYQLCNQVCPHINLFSGTVEEYDIFLSEIKKITFPKQTDFKSFGLGLFIEKKPVLYLRYENCKYFSLIRKELNSLKIWLKKDKFSKKKFWIPKTTIAINDLRYDDFPKIYEILSKIDFKKIISSNTLILIEYKKGKKEKLLGSLKIN